MTATYAAVPTFTRGDRMAKAMHVAGITAQAMAVELGVTRNTVTRYVHDRVNVPRAVLIAWAHLTGVSLHWLETGEPNGDEPPNGRHLTAV